MGYSVGKVGKMFGLSRTALLYYDTMGLLRPSGRSKADYRLYSEEDIEKLKKIMLYREAGIPLNEIAKLIPEDESGLASILFKRLKELNCQINQIKTQQETVVRILKQCSLIKDLRNLDITVWESILKAAELDEAGRFRFHADLEKFSPEQHQEFLEALGLNEEERKMIREMARRFNEGNKDGVEYDFHKKA